MKEEGEKTAHYSRRFFIYGLLAGIIAILALYIGTGFLDLPYPPEAVFQLLIAPVPGSVQSVAVETLGEYAKYSAFIVAAAIYSILYAFIGTLLGIAFRGRTQSKSLQPVLIGAIIPTAIGLGLQAQLAEETSTLSSLYGWLTAVFLMFAVNVLYAGLVVYQARAALDVKSPSTVEEVTQPSSSSRRGFLKKIAIVTALLAVAAIVSRVGLSLLSGQPIITSNTPIPIDNPPEQTNLADLPTVFRDPRISELVGSEVTDNRVFYRVDIDFIPPQLNFDQWTLKISGKVNNPQEFDKITFLQLPTLDEYTTFECVSNTIDPPGALIGTAKWTGVPLGALLRHVGLTSDAKFVVFHCADGYTVGIPLERAMRPESLLAYKMNDDPLPTGHGFPLRAVVPSIYGMMSAKWITGIEVVNSLYLGYWQERGWSNDAKIKTTSLIYYPPSGAQVNRTLPIAGIAFAGDRGISKVEVSVDDGNTWNEATLKKPRSPFSWVLWAYGWTPTVKGNVTITVRAYDGTGKLQDPTVSPPFPDGASGYNSVQVTVT